MAPKKNPVEKDATRRSNRANAGDSEASAACKQNALNQVINILYEKILKTENFLGLNIEIALIFCKTFNVYRSYYLMGFTLEVVRRVQLSNNQD